MTYEGLPEIPVHDVDFSRGLGIVSNSLEQGLQCLVRTMLVQLFAACPIKTNDVASLTIRRADDALLVVEGFITRPQHQSLIFRHVLDASSVKSQVGEEDA